MASHHTHAGPGINGLDMKQVKLDNTESQLPKNTATFTTVAAAVNLGLKILESSHGKDVLQQLGNGVVQGWIAQDEPFEFQGSIAVMAQYVQHFLQELRRDFAQIVIADIAGPHVLASSQRVPGWNGDLLNYVPKMALEMTFNHCVRCC
ncbi:hypothetical protein SPI_01143 [Niveomyces insectorum RCEF 264]|uniref:Uncharacterized protein n=1 Tax=Niveomyces insectorum RCEF 264 TaxID=1081102 RepID=A0A167YQA6_9HYPO|nr:hypothetical protein SPI_01143 [Niveomyces insectorum RCEF 264]